MKKVLSVLSKIFHHFLKFATLFIRLWNETNKEDENIMSDENDKEI